eukprot:TRINITY_DN3012_c0_g1_i1.p1 TRINITY_DN3012_c0_g1~~TRINITY_DN3012_c0_g1_i1.p1  ORF type:complete len:334 (-),score=74.33 TRINITY_DN3012_c0_g1_i1:25-1026(-)
MKAVLVSKPGGRDQLSIGEVDKPSLNVEGGQDSILVKTLAAGINRADINQREGKYPPPKGASEILGMEICGIIDEVGSNVTKWKKGDRIMSLISGGGYAQYTVVPQNLAMHAPSQLSDEQCAGIPEAYMTAYQSLVWNAGLTKGKRVLVHAGASGVGLACIQLIKLFEGTQVIVTAGSEEKIAFCKSLGADEGINYKTTPEFSKKVLEATGGKGVDILIDFIGQSYWKENLASLGVEGTMVILAYMSGTKVSEFDMAPFLQKRITIKGSTLRARDLEYRAKLAKEVDELLGDHFRSGKIVPTISKVFSYESVKDAHKFMEDNANTGKIILNSF